MAKSVPTDLQILQVIYDMYYDDFCSFENDNPTRAAKIFVPIDCQKIAYKLGTDGDIVFGRLYYHLANKYKYTDHGDKLSSSTVKLFEFQIGKDSKCVHFPFMASVLADLKIEARRFKLTLTASFIAVCISIASLMFTGFEKLFSYLY
ncbi:hypothetical protein [Shewanella baltica]|uniref:hypothetical protein n=1 Tax=Shewanella baltica TaxID=62322 RepID=UPI00217CD338|nr:hypothetical protein [Shewanella baltica]MCS6098967.1 hypothetical protein [Shewanella baltica]MCS6182077.1 hypothetical protein [Shewanella baltica]